MNAAMSELGELGIDAKSDSDIVRAACVLDKQDRANNVMDLATSEALIVKDGSTGDTARRFAGEKLNEAAAKLQDLVLEAKACTGGDGPEHEADVVRNEADEPRTVPYFNLTGGLGDSAVPPVGADGWPPVTSPYY
jgi:hypothetical protein